MCSCNLRLKSKTKGNKVRYRSDSVSAPRPHGNCDLKGDWRKSCIRSGATGQVSFPGALENNRQGLTQSWVCDWGTGVSGGDPGSALGAD